MKHLDLFSGIGGFALAARWAGWETVAFCEIDKWCQKILHKHWPDVPIHSDVKELHGDTVGPVDIITGGYPCQPFSVAGQRRGADDDRHVWPEAARLVRELQPAFAVFENVAGHVTLGLDEVLSDLEGLGYTTETFVIPACAVDAWHRRDRVWIVGYSDQQSKHCVGKRTGRMDGNILEAPEWNEKTDAFNESSEDVANTSRQGLSGLCSTSGIQSQHANDGQYSRWLPEPAVGRMANGIPNRVDRLRGLGNAIVPQVAHVIFEAINADLSR